jgi:GNAT superfamily N-acetyltransferase
MDNSELLALHDQQQRIQLEERGMRREATAEVVRHINLRQGEGAVIHSRLHPGNADRIIAEQIAHFRDIGQDFEWKLYGHDTPSDLGARLLALGFEAEEPESLLILDLEDTPESLLKPVTLDVRRIAEPARLDEIERIQESVWGESDPDYIAGLKEDLAQDPEHVSIYLAYAEGVPVAHARITFHDRSLFAGLWGGSTLAEYRGLGFYTALLAARVQEARARGIHFLTIDASPMSRPIVERRGFRYLTMTQPFKMRVKTPGANS